MAAGDLHLSVHVGHRWTAAVATVDGRSWPVTFEGKTSIPSGTFINGDTGSVLAGPAAAAAGATQPDSYLADPMSQLRVSTAGAEAPPISAVSALLAFAANNAAAQAGTRVATLTVTTPQPWGHTSRQRLTRAAITAGLPEPAIVTAAAAAAATGADIADGFVLVCAVDDDYPTLTALDVTAQYTQLAASTVQAPDSPGIHQTLAASLQNRDGNAGPATALDWRTSAEIDRARTTLTSTARTAVLLPDQPSPVVIEAADLAAAAQPHLDQLGPTLTELLTDADIELADLSATVLVAYDATAPAAQAALADAGLPPPTTITGPEQLAAGAARLTAHSMPGSAPTAATTRLPRTKLTLRALSGTALLAAAAFTMLIQTITSAYIHQLWLGTEPYAVSLSKENLALAAALAATAATAAAHLAPTTWFSPPNLADQASTGWILRRAYLTAAAAGIALAGLFGLGSGIGVRLIDAAYLQWTLTAATPIAVSAAIIALAAPRIPATRLPAWLEYVRPPLWPIMTATAGVALTRAAYTYDFPVNITGQVTLTAAIGAGLIGAATAATVTRQKAIRIAIGLILVPGYALVGTAATIQYLTITYIAALIWWHLTTTALTLRDTGTDGHPLHRWLARI